MRITEAFTSAAASLTGLLSNATGATWTLTATSAADGCAHKITVRNDSGTDHGAKTADLTGTAYDGSALTETISLPAGTSTVTSTGYFLTLTSIVPSASIGGDTMDIGWAVDSVTPPVAIGIRPGNAASTIGFSCEITDTPTYTMQHSYGGVWFNHSSVAAETTNQEGSYTVPILAMRLLFAAAGTVTINALVAGQ